MSPQNGFRAAFVAIVSALLFTGCGGGGGGERSMPTSALPAPVVTSTPALQTEAGGPVTYLQSTGPLSSTGSVAQGSRQAIIAVMSGDAAPSNTFSFDTLQVLTPAMQSASVLRRAAAAMRPGRQAPVEAFPADGGALARLLQPGPGGRSVASRRSAQSVLPDAPGVGSQAAIWVQQGPIGGSRPSVQVPATLLAQTVHGNIWADDTIVSAVQPSIAQIAADFENGYASDTSHFASPDYPSNAPGMQPQYNACSSSGAKNGTTPAYIAEPADRRINVMVVDSSSIGGLGGYFSAANYMHQSALNCLKAGYESNEAPFIFVGWFASNGTDYDVREDLVRSTAHELQHLINFVNHAILAAGASSQSFSGYESTFINEGLSMLAQDFAVARMYGSQGVQFDAADALARASTYLDNPGNYSLSAFSGIDPSVWGGNGSPQYNCSAGCYGVAYLFERYLRDRFGGDAYAHAIETSGVVGEPNLQQVTGESAGDLQDDFALAMAANTMHVTSPQTRFDFGSLSLTQSYPDQFGGATALGGVNATPIAGPATTVQAPLGGFTYVSASSIPASGLPVQVMDQASVSGFALAGGLAQH